MSRYITKYHVVMQLTEPMLGTVPKNRDVYTRFIRTRSQKELEKMRERGVPAANGDGLTEGSITALLDEETQAVEDAEENGWSTFMIDERETLDPPGGPPGSGPPNPDVGRPFIFDYLPKGCLKEAARRLKEYDPDDESEPDEVASKKKGKSAVIKQLRSKVASHLFIMPRRIYLPPIDGRLERPLRASTPQGERVTVVRSDTVPAGTLLDFEIHVLAGAGLTAGVLKELLEITQYNGFGQFRGGSYGRAALLSFERV